MSQVVRFCYHSCLGLGSWASRPRRLYSLLTSTVKVISDVFLTHFRPSSCCLHPRSPPGGPVGDISVEGKCPLENEVSVEMSVEVSVERKMSNFGNFHPPAFAFPVLSESDAFRSRIPQFTGKETDYQGWKIQIVGYFRKKGLAERLTDCTPPTILNKPDAKAKLMSIDADKSEDERRYVYVNGRLDADASKRLLNADTKKVIETQTETLDDWTAEQKSIFDDLALAVSPGGQPMKLINSVRWQRW